MKTSEISYNNASEALEHVANFLRNCPQYSGSELDANLIFERLDREGRQFTADELESTFHELAGEGLIDDGTDNPVTDLLSPVEDERTYEPEPETNEIEITFIPEEDEVSREEIEALSTKQIGDLLKQHDEQSAPPKSLNDEISGLSLGDLGHLIMKVSTQ